MKRPAIGVALVCLLFSACRGIHDKDGEKAVDPSKVIQVDGATAAFPITQSITSEFNHLHPDISVSVGLSGTGVGFQKFCSGDSDVLEASRPIKSAEEDACSRKGIHYIELPFAYDAVAVVVNPQNTWVSSMTTAELKKLWDVSSESKVMRWKDIRSSWPDADVHLFGPGLDSGAFDYFTAAINGAEGVGRGDYTATEDEDVLVSGISRDPLALGYLGLAYYVRHKDVLKIIAVQDSEYGPELPDPVVPSTETIIEGTYRRLSRPLFLYVNDERTSRSNVVQFVEFYLRNAPRVAAEIHCVPLPGRAYAIALERFHNRITGSVFKDDARTGIRIDQLVHLQETGLRR